MAMTPVPLSLLFLLVALLAPWPPAVTAHFHQTQDHTSLGVRASHHDTGSRRASAFGALKDYAAYHMGLGGILSSEDRRFKFGAPTLGAAIENESDLFAVLYSASAWGGDEIATDEDVKKYRTFLKDRSIPDLNIATMVERPQSHDSTTYDYTGDNAGKQVLFNVLKGTPPSCTSSKDKCSGKKRYSFQSRLFVTISTS
eukprot:GFYU01057869.1.p1 GENE.GFYU01057869.1~~GFYU01057869.1.p1  ORF type:complete len:215 (+),score=17.10 GFYU01057869.1:49-645(+)